MTKPVYWYYIQLGSNEYQSQCFTDAHAAFYAGPNLVRVWRQGPRGGVKLIVDNRNNKYGYITADEAEMQDFAWAKLAAKNLNH
jgi:hypothetical protein